MSTGSPWGRLALMAGLALFAGCAPVTNYRHTAYVPAVRPIPFDGVTSPAGTLRLEGNLGWSDVSENLTPQIHDTAVRVPRWTAEASAMLSINPHVELGVRGSYADYAWSQDSAVGTMPLPTAPASTGYGPELHLAFPLTDDHRLQLGLAGNLMLYTIPYAEWQRGTCTAVSSNCVYNSGTFWGLVDTRSDSPIVYQLGAYPSYAFGPGGSYGHLFGILDATSGFSNDGFSDMPANGSTLNGVGPIFILGVGYGWSSDWGHVSGSIYRPLTDQSSPVDYGFAFQISLGVNIDLWRSPEAPPAAPPPAAQPPPPAAAPLPAAAPPPAEARPGPPS
ncbi:MAG: hypothetical protein ACRENE_22595 [Polyangiaceae bacterium]